MRSTQGEVPQPQPGDEYDLMSRGSRALNDGNISEAIDCFRRARDLSSAIYGDASLEHALSCCRYGVVLLCGVPIIVDNDPITALSKEARDYFGVGFAASINWPKDFHPSNSNDMERAWKELNAAWSIVEKKKSCPMEKVEILSSLGEAALRKGELNAESYFHKAMIILEPVAEIDDQRSLYLLRLCRTYRTLSREPTINPIWSPEVEILNEILYTLGKHLEDLRREPGSSFTHTSEEAPSWRFKGSPDKPCFIQTPTFLRNQEITPNKAPVISVSNHRPELMPWWMRREDETCASAYQGNGANPVSLRNQEATPNKAPVIPISNHGPGFKSWRREQIFALANQENRFSKRGKTSNHTSLVNHRRISTEATHHSPEAFTRKKENEATARHTSSIDHKTTTSSDANLISGYSRGHETISGKTSTTTTLEEDEKGNTNNPSRNQENVSSETTSASTFSQKDRTTGNASSLAAVSAARILMGMSLAKNL